MKHQHDHDHKHEDGHQCVCETNSSVTQTLDELGFERGIWGNIINGNYKRVTELLEKNPKLSNAIDSSGYYPLHYAVRSDSNVDIVQVLIDNGASLRCITTHGAATPLHRSSFCGALKITKLILSIDSTMINQQDVDGMTPLHKAYQQKHNDIVSLLLTYKADENIKDKKDKIPLDYK
ncbi:ankyrin repeat-containing protein 39 [Tieghemostelium lacteum]|uniref:Ankyrin repeat-containing protein 39 n=1 Tax=Tieghemostelium lacteum TaxID=361077 RepID=A0A151Z8D3_TIELA|nr:ankyrin repeat-containing protein 39 [Tieghemostelium lacteum]|eukprot:KYQ90229.1 ankyrin repeat-containing protein 39 [Tieghemostelium lacteum]